MFATASDLIAADDIDDVLARITDRAAVEVRAPRLPGGGAADPRRARSTATTRASTTTRRRSTPSVCARAPPRVAPDSWLVVPVGSNRREYGRLLAMHDAGPALLRARSASCCRCTPATPPARWTARPPCWRPSSATTSRRAAGAGAGAGPRRDQRARSRCGWPTRCRSVVDCDRVGVYLWDAERDELVRAGALSAGGDGGPEVSDALELGSRARRPAGGVCCNDPSREPHVRRRPQDGGPAARAARRDRHGGDDHRAAGHRRTRSWGCCRCRCASAPSGCKPHRGPARPAVGRRRPGHHRASERRARRLRSPIRPLHDQLTGLANRLQFTDQLRAAINRARTGVSESVTLFYVDLDRFKPVNDEFGHEIGDAAAGRRGQAAERCTRAADVVARLGGDEFAVLLVAAGAERDRGGHRAHRRRVRRAVHDRRAAACDSAPASGARCIPIDADDPDGLLRRADSAMFEDKRAHHAERAALRQSQAAA